MMAAYQQIEDLELTADYKEESVGVPLLITVVILLLVAAPLVYWIFKINQEGSRSTNVSKHDVLLEMVENNVKTVDAMLRNDAEELAAINRSSRPVVTLIVPEVVIIEEKNNEPRKPSALKIELEGIYWSPSNPFVGIDGEIYRVGDSIQGYEIVRIAKTSVQFQAGDGTIVVMDMYDNLLK